MAARPKVAPSMSAQARHRMCAPEEELRNEEIDYSIR